MTPRKPRRRVSPHTVAVNKARPHYDHLLAAQDGVCAICGHPPVNRRLDIDTDHRNSYQVRGLLCHFCNRTLAPRITVDWMRKAISYLERDPIRLPEEDT